MKKHIRLAVLAILILIHGNPGPVQAEILPPHGEGQIGLQAVILCENLTLRQAPGSGSRFSPS